MAIIQKENNVNFSYEYLLVFSGHWTTYCPFYRSSHIYSSPLISSFFLIEKCLWFGLILVHLCVLFVQD